MTAAKREGKEMKDRGVRCWKCFGFIVCVCVCVCMYVCLCVCVCMPTHLAGHLYQEDHVFGRSRAPISITLLTRKLQLSNTNRSRK